MACQKLSQEKELVSLTASRYIIMFDILEYVKNNLITFEKKPLNEVDAMVFSWLTYYRLPKAMYKANSFEKIYLKDFYNAKYFDNLLLDIFEREKSKLLLSYVAASPRFRDIEMFYYVEKTSKKVEEQFSAMTFKITKNDYVVAYRGTDHTFVGWKEDINMSFLKNVPSQLEAKKYLGKIASKVKGNIYIAGHSKGGNLAVYAGNFIDDKKASRIKCIYNFDGPNLNKELSDGIKHNVINKHIKKVVPQSSVVGMCFDTTSNYQIIRSNAIGVLQHSPFSWEVDKDKFKILKDTAFDSKMFKKGINALINNLSQDELKLFADTIYSIIEGTQANTVEELMSNVAKNAKVIFESFSGMNNEQKKLMSKVTDMFIKEAFKI